MGSNSGFTACEITRSGIRQDGIAVAVKIIAKHPGVDSFTCGWIHAGGDVEWSGGMWVIAGRTDKMLPAEFAKATKMQSRVTEAMKKGLIIEVPRRVIRPDNTKSTGYRVAGAGGSFAGVGGSAASVAGDAAKQLKNDNKRVMKQRVVDAPLPVPVKSSEKVGMPDNFRDGLGYGGDD